MQQKTCRHTHCSNVEKSSNRACKKTMQENWTGSLHPLNWLSNNAIFHAGYFIILTVYYQQILLSCAITLQPSVESPMIVDIQLLFITIVILLCTHHLMLHEKYKIYSLQPRVDIISTVDGSWDRLSAAECERKVNNSIPCRVGPRGTIKTCMNRDNVEF